MQAVVPQGARFVRLHWRCSGHRGRTVYLAADEDGRGIKLSGLREAPHTVWALEHLTDPYGERAFLLRGAYGRYVVADKYQRPRVIQGDWVDEVAPPEMLWQLLQTGGDLLVGSRLGGFLRATISYGYADVVVGENDGSTMLHWGVEVVPSLAHTADRIDSLMQLQKHTKVQWKGEGSKIIRYVKADLDGVINEMAWSNIRLNSNSLVITMQMILQQDNDVLHAAICVRGGQYGQLTPLLVDLPTSNDRVDVVLLSPNTAAHLHLLYPEWRAESMAWPVPLPRLAVASSAEGPEGLSILDKMDKYLPDEKYFTP